MFCAVLSLRGSNLPILAISGEDAIPKKWEEIVPSKCAQFKVAELGCQKGLDVFRIYCHKRRIPKEILLPSRDTHLVCNRDHFSGDHLLSVCLDYTPHHVCTEWPFVWAPWRGFTAQLCGSLSMTTIGKVRVYKSVDGESEDKQERICGISMHCGDSEFQPSMVRNTERKPEDLRRYKG